MTYDPFFGAREPAPAAHRRSDAAWAQVREDYLAGASAPQLAERHGVSVSALRKRAREEGWRRSDAPDAPPPGAEDDDAALAEAAAATPAELRPLAWARAALAVRRGRLQEALGWTRLVRQLDRMAEAASPAVQARAAASLASAAETLSALRERVAQPEPHDAPPPPQAGEVDGAPDMHEIHACAPRACAEGAVEDRGAQPGGGGDARPTAGGGPAPSIGRAPAASPAAAPQGRSEMHEVHGVGEDAPSPAPPPRPTGPAVPPTPPDWVLRRLRAG